MVQGGGWCSWNGAVELGRVGNGGWGGVCAGTRGSGSAGVRWDGVGTAWCSQGYQGIEVIRGLWGGVCIM